jgi:glutathione S-transferase
MLKFSGLPFKEVLVDLHDSSNRAELLLLSPSILVPRLQHNSVIVWDTLAIGEYLNEITSQAKLLPSNSSAASTLPFNLWGNAFRIFCVTGILTHESKSKL